ncbi:hypothetical protein ARC20_11840 [Stenotrophomonas panacihumi]|uniref:Adhesin n=1 Tax=Stenotrophomonas panacihumi TaxID=676599 RepID=A0A0R0AGV3_9GAMM|nr:hypothetical protein [Stenotrophomonas panacihumi]KRG41130.1 hypothetical protein ARC20_11840 [Stenotrophomonas panacihumi]PTN55167.1 hypothetical protein C9J98_07065 [Stenotrophomonas panacihumi]
MAMAQSGDDYAQMLGYLADSRIDGRALSNASGAIAVNQAAGDLNLQANLRALANGGRAQAQVQAIQIHAGDRYDTPLHASATLGGDALSGASGIASINQASGSGNTELNAVAATLADQGIRETNDDTLASFASAGGQGEAADGQPGGTRSVGVESTALRGFGGVLQLNQIAGSGNATGNQLSLSVQNP